MVTLYSMAGSSALAVHIALEWSGLPYKVIILKDGENHDLNYLRKTPLGRVPAFEFEDGCVITETIALLLYVNAICPNAFMTPSDGALGIAALAEKLSFYTTEICGAFSPFLYPSRYHSDCTEHKALKQQACVRLQRYFDLTDDSLIGPYVFGNDRSVADGYLYVLTLWFDQTPMELEDYPLLSAFRSSMERDAGVNRVLNQYIAQ